MNYTTEKVVRTTLIFILAALVVFAGYVIGSARADKPLTCWALCKPGTQVNVRRTPDKRGQVVGYLEVGDSFQTDGVSKNGYLRALGIGEFGEAWIYCGYTVTEKPEAVYENYSCVAKNRVAVRKWVEGPQVSWLKNGSEVQVFYIAGDWAVTSRGYVQHEWLEVAP